MLHPEIKFIPASMDLKKIRLFGTLMPALLLLFKHPDRFVYYQWKERLTPKLTPEEMINTGADDVAQVGNILFFIHSWQTREFDAVTFARSHAFLRQLGRLMRLEGYDVELIDALSPEINLPKMASEAGLGNLSPFGLLVHPVYGPRLIISGIKTNYPISLKPRWGDDHGCTDCLACIKVCPQKPAETGIVNLKLCQRCALCISVCPVEG